MHPPYFENPPPMSGDFPLPKGRANCAVNELIEFEGQTFRNCIGQGWAKVPLKHPIIADTLLGIIEITPLLDASGNSSSETLPPKTSSELDEGVGIRPPRHSRHKLGSYQPTPQGAPLH